MHRNGAGVIHCSPAAADKLAGHSNHVSRCKGPYLGSSTSGRLMLVTFEASVKSPWPKASRGDVPRSSWTRDRVADVPPRFDVCIVSNGLWSLPARDPGNWLAVKSSEGVIAAMMLLLLLGTSKSARCGESCGESWSDGACESQTRAKTHRHLDFESFSHRAISARKCIPA